MTAITPSSPSGFPSKSDLALPVPVDPNARAKELAHAREAVASLFDAGAVGQAFVEQGITIGKLVEVLTRNLEDPDGKISNAAIANIRGLAKDAARYSGIIGTATITKGADGTQVSSVSVGGRLDANGQPATPTPFHAQVEDLSHLQSDARLLQPSFSSGRTPPELLDAEVVPAPGQGG